MYRMPESRYARQTMLPAFGEDGQRRLAAASVLIVGLGGLGAPVASYLAAAGVGCIGLCDPDTVSLTNLQRQLLYDEDCLGKPKTEAARRRLMALNRQVHCHLWPEGLTPDNAAAIVAPYDLVVDCCDNFATRYLIDDVCARMGKPWVYGAIGAFDGQVALMGGRSGLRYATLFPDREVLCARPRRVAGVLGPVPGVVGAMQAMVAIQWLSGMPVAADGRLCAIDLTTIQTNTIDYGQQ